MIFVKESFETKNITILVCEMFSDDVVTDTLVTDVGSFNNREFAVMENKACFSIPTTRHVVIRKTNLPKKIEKINFV